MSFLIHHADCLELLPKMRGEWVDAVVTDPPYGLGFMGKDWDHGIPGLHFWSEILRVAKPGAHLLAFGGTRTFHRLACAIEEAGWEIRDCVMWVYGTGFPKSLDVSKAIDKAAGAEREVVGENPNAVGRSTNKTGGRLIGGHEQDRGAVDVITAPATDAAKQWDGWGTALKPAWEPIIVARKSLVGTVAENVLTHGTGAINIDGCRIPTSAGDAKAMERVNSPGSGRNYGYTARQTTEGKWDGPIGTGPMDTTKGRWPANLCHDGSDDVVALFPEGHARGNSGESKGGGGMYGHGKCTNNFGSGDSGSAARFFYCAKASRSEREAGCEGIEPVTGAEAVEREEDTAGLQSPRAGAGRSATVVRNNHPTVKPLDLMCWLVRLVCPPGGVVLDPFVGSGSTGCACVLEGMRVVGIDQDARSCEIARARIAYWESKAGVA